MSVRTITFPVKWPSGKDDQETLRKLLRSAYAAATTVSQEALRDILAVDSYVRQPGDEKLPSCPKMCLYKKGDERWTGWAASANCIVRHIEKTWRKRRRDVLWTNKAGIPSYRYPQPYPFHNQTWRVVDDTNRLVVELTILGTRIELEMKLGPGQRRGLQAIRRMAKGEYKQGEAAVYERSDRTTMFKAVVTVPDKVREYDGVLRVFSDSNAFLIAENDKANQLWILNALHVREWIVKHDVALRRQKEELKASRRLRTSNRAGMLASYEEKRRKHINRINSFVHEASSQVVRYAAGRRFAVIEYDLTNHDYFPHFPWERLEAMIVDKATHEGMRVVKYYRTTGDCSHEVTNC